MILKYLLADIKFTALTVGDFQIYDEVDMMSGQHRFYKLAEFLQRNGWSESK